MKRSFCILATRTTDHPGEPVDTFFKYLSVAAGGAAGAVLRYFISLSGLSRIGEPFPSSTFVINITGSFIIGFFLTLVSERVPMNPHIRLAVAVGFVGAYTTFSTFEYETARLIEGKDFLYAFMYVVLSFTIGFGAVWAGIVLARQVEHVPATAQITETQFFEGEQPSIAVNVPSLGREDVELKSGSTSEKVVR
jgi:fluoride exporter